MTEVQRNKKNVSEKTINQWKNKRRLTYTHVRVSDILFRVFIVERFAHVTLVAHGVVLAVVTHSSADISRGQIHSQIKVANVGVAITVTLWHKAQISIRLTTNTT